MHQILPCLLFIIFRLELIDLKKPSEPKVYHDCQMPSGYSREQFFSYVRFPSSVTSKHSISSSFVSFVNGVPFVSYAHLSRPSAVKYASVDGVRNTKDSDFPLGF